MKKFLRVLLSLVVIVCLIIGAAFLLKGTPDLSESRVSDETDSVSLSVDIDTSDSIAATSSAPQVGDASVSANTSGETIDGSISHDKTSDDFGEWITTKEATCTEVGEEKRTSLSDPEKFETREVDALGHDLISHEAKEVTCLEKGWNAYDTCSRCDYTTYEEIEALGHDIQQYKAKEATCTEAGWKAYDACSRCDYSTYEEIEPLGHDLISHEAQKATCTVKGWNASTHVLVVTLQLTKRLKL